VQLSKIEPPAPLVLHLQVLGSACPPRFCFSIPSSHQTCSHVISGPCLVQQILMDMFLFTFGEFILFMLFSLLIYSWTC